MNPTDDATGKMSKHCPFCDDTWLHVVSCAEGMRGECGHCGAMGPARPSTEAAAIAWDTRVPDAPSEGEVSYESLWHHYNVVWHCLNGRNDPPALKVLAEHPRPEDLKPPKGTQDNDQ